MMLVKVTMSIALFILVFVLVSLQEHLEAKGWL